MKNKVMLINTLPRLDYWKITTGVASGIQISEFIREINPTVPIVWGGIHPTLFPEQTLRDPSVDIIVWGEGEETSIDLAYALKKREPLKKVKGIGFKVNGGQSFTGRRGFINLEMASFPNS